MAAKVQIIGDNQKFLRSLDETGKRIKDIENQMQDITKATERFNSIANKAFVGAAVLGAPLLIATQQAAKFDEKMAEVATLGGTPEAIAKLRKELLELSGSTGINELEATAAAYQAISSGAVSAADATGLLTAASKLAIGGVTTLDTAVDGLTTALNAYGPELLDSNDKTMALRRASDILFIGMKAGKTTVAELSQNLGLFSPIAAAANLKMSETIAALSAITTAGNTTSVAATQLRAIFTSVARATDVARSRARELGLDFSFTALKAKGLKGFLDDVKKATGGNVATLTKLFGRVEAVQGVIALTGKQSATFSKILKDMNKSLDKTGDVTEIAFKRLLDTPARRQAISFQKWRVASVKLGTALLPLLDKFSELSGTVADFIGENEWVAWTGAAGAGGLLLVGVLGKLVVAFIQITRAMAIAQARALRLSRGLFTVRRAGKGAVLALISLGIAGIIASQENVEELSDDQLKDRLAKRKEDLEKLVARFNKSVDIPIVPGFGGLPGSGSRRDIGQRVSSARRVIKELQDELDVRAELERLKSDEAQFKGLGLSGAGALGLGADLAREIKAPISQRIVKIDTLNIPLNIPETVDRQMFLDILRDVFENDVLNAEGIEPVGS